MTPARFLDTNILLYAISDEPSEGMKRERAVELLALDDNALSAQVLAEFYAQATRPTRRGALSAALAEEFVLTWARFPVQPITLGIVTDAMRIHATYGFSYSDSAIIAATVASGCRELCTEDMSHGREVEGIRIVNPFR